MSLTNKTFINNRTGESVKVIDTFENIAILENKKKIDVSALTDPLQFTPDVDPSDFFNDRSDYSALLDKIKNIPTDNMIDDSITESFGMEVRPENNESAVIMSTKEDEMAELARKYGVQTDNNSAVARQQQAFSKYLDDDVNDNTVTKIEVNKVQQVEAQREYQQPVQRVEVDDPIISMFKRTKRGVNFTVNIDYNNKIPRLDFIEMMEDSYETSMINYLADEFTKEILSNPNQLKDRIKDKIKQLVYGGDITRKNDKLNPPKLAKERGEWLSKKESIKEIEDLLKTEKSKTVIKIANQRIEELKNKD